MPSNREDEAGALYIEGFKAVREGGHELKMLAGHLRHMIRGTSDFPGPLWQVRHVPPDGLRVELDRFADYLLKPARTGLGLPSLHFLRQVLKATPKGGEQALQFVREELKRVDGIDLDDEADREHKSVQAKKKLPKDGEVGRGRPNSLDNIKAKGGTSADYLASRLGRDHQDLSARTLLPKSDMLHLSIRKAAIAAGIVKVPSALDRLRTAWAKASADERATFLAEVER